MDIIAGDYIQRNYEVAAMNGTILQIGVLKGLADKVNIFPMLAKRLTHTGATLRSQSAEAKAEVMAALQEKVWPLISKGQIKPLLYKTFDLEEARQAHEFLDQGQHVGKLALIVKNKTESKKTSINWSFYNKIIINLYRESSLFPLLS